MRNDKNQVNSRYFITKKWRKKAASIHSNIVNGCDNTDSAARNYLSSIAKHLSMNIECAKAYCDDCFSVLSRARSCRHLEVLESVYIHVQRPNLCVQKETVKPLLLFKSHLAPVG